MWTLVFVTLITLLEAAECALIRCDSWNFATSNVRCNVKGSQVLTETSDNENPIDEDSFCVHSSDCFANQILLSNGLISNEEYGDILRRIHRVAMCKQA